MPAEPAEGSPLDTETQLRSLVEKRVKNGVSIRADTRLADAGLDSLDVIEIAFDIEDKFRIQLPRLSAESTSATYGDLCRAVDDQLASTMAAGARPQP
jgi:acyl carrier protein